jgi:uncharacterized membrane protein
LGKGRLEAFTDGVIAIIITIIVLELKVPETNSVAGLISILPVFLVYALSFTNVGIFWNNHHHMLHAARLINGNVLWANLFLLFWLSLVPFTIRWMDEAHFSSLPAASYGFVLAMSAFGYILLERTIIACNTMDPALAEAIGGNRKSLLSLLIYIAAMPLAFVSPWIALALYAAIAMMWFVPDRRIEAIVTGKAHDAPD